MRYLVLTILCPILFVLFTSCKSSSVTNPSNDDNILEFVDSEACDYWIAFLPVNESKGLYRVALDCENGEDPEFVLMFNGTQVDTAGNDYATVSANPGQTYDGVLYVDEVEYPFTIKIAQSLINVVCDYHPTTPHLSWELPSSNMHQFVEGWFTTDNGEDFIDVFLPANKRNYTFANRPYTTVSLATLNSYNSSDNKFGVYSWSFKQFDIDQDVQ